MEEREDNYDIERYPRPSVPVDVLLFTVRSAQPRPHQLPVLSLEVLLVNRAAWPYPHAWALPGGFSTPRETLEMTVARELAEETGLTDVHTRHLGVYSTLGRDPRGWIISSAYYALVDATRLQPRAGDDARDVRWWPVPTVLAWPTAHVRDAALNERVLSLAFDHRVMVMDALRQLRQDAHTTDVLRHLLPTSFTLGELQQLLVLLDPTYQELPQNLRRKVLKRGVIVPTGEYSNRSSKRESELYSFTGHYPRLSIY